MRMSRDLISSDELTQDSWHEDNPGAKEKFFQVPMLPHYCRVSLLQSLFQLLHGGLCLASFFAWQACRFKYVSAALYCRGTVSNTEHEP